MATPRKRFEQQPDEILDYRIDYSAWLNGDTIASSVWTVPANLSQPRSVTSTLTSATIWLSGKVEGSFDVQHTLTTTAGRKKIQVFTLTIQRAI